MPPRPKTPSSGGSTPDGRTPDGGGTPDGSTPKKPSQKHGSIDASKDASSAQDAIGEVAKTGRATDASGAPPKPQISPSKFDEVRDTPKGQRPDPSTYMSQKDIDAHLQPFREHGAVRVTSRQGIKDFGTIGPKDGTFVMPANEFKALVDRSGGDLSKVEQELGLEPGALTGGSSVAVYIKPEDLGNLRMPSGNEAGANKYWEPGGYTSGGMAEATVDAPADLPYEEIDL